jgi:hypothetical protein
MKEWLQACVTNHERCRQWCSKQRTSNKRPTRVVELTAHGVKLQCDVETIVDFEYVTLSHIWGPDPAKQLRLSTSNLEDLKVAIPTDELPAIFKEAIRITRHLGFKYIWIDSLSKPCSGYEVGVLTLMRQTAVLILYLINNVSLAQDF